MCIRMQMSSIFIVLISVVFRDEQVETTKFFRVNFHLPQCFIPPLLLPFFPPLLPTPYLFSSHPIIFTLSYPRLALPRKLWPSGTVLVARSGPTAQWGACKDVWWAPLLNHLLLFMLGLPFLFQPKLPHRVDVTLKWGSENHVCHPKITDGQAE